MPTTGKPSPWRRRRPEQVEGESVFDAHEYGPLELENRFSWQLSSSRRCSIFWVSIADRWTVTVSAMIAERFRNEFGLDAAVILNAPERDQVPEVNRGDGMIHLIHHGGAARYRKLETLIEVVAQCDHRFHLHFMLMENDPGYLRSLKSLADRQASGRVTFHPPVPPPDVVRFISRFDIGVYLLPPDSFNNRAALPNKFFDFIAAGLAICIGPSGHGRDGASSVQRLRGPFFPREMAVELMRLGSSDLEGMKKASKEASLLLNAQTEMAKLVGLYREGPLLGQPC